MLAVMRVPQPEVQINLVQVLVLHAVEPVRFDRNKVFFPLKITIVFAVVRPITRPPWVKWPLSVRDSAAHEKNKMGNTQQIMRFKAALLGVCRDQMRRWGFFLFSAGHR